MPKKPKKLNLKTPRATEARMAWLLYKDPAKRKQALIHLMKGNNSEQDER